MFFKRVNQTNSTLQVQCCASGPCRMRFTELCKTCKKNIGAKQDANYYKKK